MTRPPMLPGGWAGLALVVVSGIVVACGPTAGPSPSPLRTPAATARADSGPTASVTAAPNVLFGTWRRTGSCREFVDAMRAAGLLDLVGVTDGKWMAGGVTPKGTDPAAAGYCDGAALVQHSHFFTAGGRFGSLDENGQQVDDGTYELRGDDVLVFGPITVRFAIDAGDHLSFNEVTVADPCPASGFPPPSAPPGAPIDCRPDLGWALSAFYPGSYERVGP